jgi:hypothetical protein
MKSTLALMALASSAHASILHVLVVDADNKPRAGVPLAIRSALIGVVVPACEAKTNGEGVAEFADVERWLTDEIQARVPQVEFGFPSLEREGLPLLMREAPKSPLRMVLPATGSLSVHLVTKESPLEVRDLSLEWQEPASGSTRLLTAESIDAVTHTALFSYVGLGIEIQVVARDSTGDELGCGGAPELMAAGETSSVDIEIPSARDMVFARGRALDEDGLPWADRSLQITLRHSLDDAWLEESSTITVHTQADGQFRAQLRDDWEPDAYVTSTNHGHTVHDSLAFLTFRIGARRDSDHAILQTLLVRDRDSGRGCTRNLDLGNIQLSSKPVLSYGVASPRVERGVQASGIHVCILERLVGKTIGGAVPPIEWRRVPAIEAHCDAQGSFVLHGQLDLAHDPPEYAQIHSYVYGEMEGALPAFAEIGSFRGPTTLRFTVPVAAHGIVQPASGVDPQSLDVEIRYSKPDALQQWLMEEPRANSGPGPGLARVDADGSFRWNGLAPGAYHLRVLARGSNDVLFESDGELISYATSDRTVELGRIELRGKLK